MAKDKTVKQLQKKDHEIKMLWRGVSEALREAVSITWDGCHKIYVAMDEQQHQEMVKLDYDMFRVDDYGHSISLARLKTWFDDSCGLRFINSVRTVKGNPNDGYDSLIEQCHPAFDEEEDEEDWEF